MIMTKPEMVLMAECAAIENGIDPAVFCALIDISSGWHPEKAEWNSSAVTAFAGEVTDEHVFQLYRWGLTQVLGSDARRAGFRGELYRLTDPELNITVGAQVLRETIAYAGGIQRALVLWRGVIGGNFPELVLAKAGQYREFLAAPERPPKLTKISTES